MDNAHIPMDIKVDFGRKKSYKVMTGAIKNWTVVTKELFKKFHSTVVRQIFGLPKSAAVDVAMYDLGLMTFPMQSLQTRARFLKKTIQKASAGAFRRSGR